MTAIDGATAMPTPLERSHIDCGLCPFKAWAATSEAARVAFRDHHDWHRLPPEDQAASFGR